MGGAPRPGGVVVQRVDGLPGDNLHRQPDILKVTSGSTPEIADDMDTLYRAIITAGTHRAPSIRVAEAAAVIEGPSATSRWPSSTSWPCCSAYSASTPMTCWRRRVPSGTSWSSRPGWLAEYSIAAEVCDPWVDTGEAKSAYGLSLVSVDDALGARWDAVVLAVAHEQFVGLAPAVRSAICDGRDLLRHGCLATGVGGRSTVG